MARIRCKETNIDSFFGNFLYEQKVAKEHFLRKLDEVVDRGDLPRSFSDTTKVREK